VSYLFFFIYMNDRNIIIGVVVLLLSVGVFLFFTGGNTATTPDVSGLSGENNVASGSNLPLAQCLKDKGAVFYGAFWCSHCRSQKALFGDAAPALPYVECSTPDGKGQTLVCREKKIESYPTWVFADGSLLNGSQSLEVLAEKSGCTAVLSGAVAPAATTSAQSGDSSPLMMDDFGREAPLPNI
jgi:hypothetical protein